MKQEEKEKLNGAVKPENRPAVWVRWIPVFSVIFVVIVIAIISQAGNSNANSDTARGESTNAASSEIEETINEPASLRYIEDVGGPHDFIEGRASANCRSCHLPQYEDWLQSPHGKALTSEAFAATFQVVEDEDISRCIACHIPQEMDIASGAVLHDPPDQGITCVSCHSRESRVGLYILEEEREIEYTDSRSPEFCAACHDPEEPLILTIAPEIAWRYGIPGRSGNPYEEWRESRYSVEGPGYVSCIECHGQGGTGTLHAWPEDVAAMVKSAYTIEKLPVEIFEGEISIGIRVTNTGAGHGLPTGDPSHVLIFDLKIFNVDSPDTTIAEERFNLGVYVDGDGHFGMNRLAPDASTEFLVYIMLDITVPPGALDVGYSVNYTYDPAFTELLTGLGIEVETILIDEG